MKPVTPLQKKVVELSSKLTLISDKQKQYAINKSFENWGTISRNTVYCLDCGFSWKEKNANLSDDSRKCPNCSKQLKLKSNDKVFKEMEYFGILTTIESYQVVRIISATKFMKKSETPTYSTVEVMQHFINESGEITTMSKLTLGLSQAYDSWILNSNLEVREDSPRGILRAKLNPWKVYPQRKILPIIKRNGFKNNFHGIAPQILFKAILTDSNAEYLLKTNQTSFLDEYLYQPSLKKYLPCIKICTRNDYIIKNFKIWKDYVDLLIYFNKDIQNPKYVCPVNLSLAHDKLVSKKRKIQRKAKYHDLKKEIEEAQKVYNHQKNDFFGLKFTDKKITVSVIEKVIDFMDEGDEHGHCLFTNEYHKKPDSLVFSARIGNKRLETVEVSLSNIKIEQSRGKGNKATKYNKNIIQLVNNNLHFISQIIDNRNQLQKVI